MKEDWEKRSKNKLQISIRNQFTNKFQ